MQKLLLFISFLFILQTSFSQNKKIIGFYPQNVEKQLSTESAFDKNLSAENIGATMKVLSAKPHNISSPGSKANAEYLLNQLKKFGWDAQIETFHVLFPTPKTRVL